MARELLLLPAATVRMGSKAWLLLRPTAATRRTRDLDFNFKSGFFSKALYVQNRVRNYSIQSDGLQPPDLPRLAETARISLTPDEVEEFAPKIRQVVDWFGQLQAVDLQSIQPAIRAGTEGENLRDDLPETFENRDAMIAAVPSYDEPFIKVPKVLNKE
ncbi:Carbon--nitrogen ligases with glutamine as amido-N-donor [Sarracenia purpurea var. burkii]